MVVEVSPLSFCSLHKIMVIGIMYIALWCIRILMINVLNRRFSVVFPVFGKSIENLKKNLFNVPGR